MSQKMNLLTPVQRPPQRVHNANPKVFEQPKLNFVARKNQCQCPCYSGTIVFKWWVLLQYSIAYLLVESLIKPLYRREELMSWTFLWDKTEPPRRNKDQK